MDILIKMSPQRLSASVLQLREVAAQRGLKQERRSHRRRSSLRPIEWWRTAKDARGHDSKTMRTARSRSSGEYLLGRAIVSILSRNEPPTNPIRLSDEAWLRFLSSSNFLPKR
jgi:hypothetical protein